MSCEVRYEELATYAAGDLASEANRCIADHVRTCAVCSDRLQAICRTDAILAAIRPVRPTARTILETRRILAEVIHPQEPSEIMTLEVAATFLRIGLDELEDIIDELPAFELAGQVRIRRSRLLEWIAQRERVYSRRSAASWAREATVSAYQKGVA